MSTLKLMMAAVILAAAPTIACAQKPDSGPQATQSGHPMRNAETGTRGPSNGSPDTGPHGQRDVTKNAEPGKPMSKEEQKKNGTSPHTSR